MASVATERVLEKQNSEQDLEYVLVTRDTKGDGKKDGDGGESPRLRRASSLTAPIGGDPPKLTCFRFAEVEEAPASPSSIPFLPLDASQEISKEGGFAEAIASAQHFIDERLDAYAEFQHMVSI